MSEPEFLKMIDLASERLGGKVLYATDDFFAEKENLLKLKPAIFIEDKFTERGKWMDGWESRRKRTPGHDWCVIQLGLPGTIRGLDIDTSHFLGNHPPQASVEWANALTEDYSGFQPLLEKVKLDPGSHHYLEVNSDKTVRFLKLNIFPDGGVARFRAYGSAKPDWQSLKNEPLVDLASVRNGGVVLDCNDMFFGPKDNLIMPERGVNMGDGWETKRKREPGHDWVIVQLGRPGKVSKIEVDTNHFKGNYPDRCSIEGLVGTSWTPLLDESKLQAHHRHFFESLHDIGSVSQVRLNIFPDGGVSRLRVWGSVE